LSADRRVFPVRAVRASTARRSPASSGRRSTGVIRHAGDPGMAEQLAWLGVDRFENGEPRWLRRRRLEGPAEQGRRFRRRNPLGRYSRRDFCGSPWSVQGERSASPAVTLKGMEPLSDGPLLLVRENSPHWCTASKLLTSCDLTQQSPSGILGTARSLPRGHMLWPNRSQKVETVVLPTGAPPPTRHVCGSSEADAPGHLPPQVGKEVMSARTLLE
jgi:hypothetical protein